jgi:hypothetical protein
MQLILRFYDPQVRHMHTTQSSSLIIFQSDRG